MAIIDSLMERSKRDTTLKSAIDDAEREYQEYLETLRPEPIDR